MRKSTIIAHILVAGGFDNRLEDAEWRVRAEYERQGPKGIPFDEWNQDLPDSWAKTFLHAQPRFTQVHWPTMFGRFLP